jgi:peptidoglycan hydrolase-like protein with peptidoglycan-binding domain
MNITELQQRLIDLGYDLGPKGADGVYGGATRQAISEAMTNRDAPRLTEADYASAAAELGCSAAVIRGITVVESGGRGGYGPTGKPVILYEPHVFSRNSGHRFDSSHPALSSRKWNRALYGKTQEHRYNQLLDAVALDVDAAFSAPSYGLFQILGENWKMCGYPSAWAMARCMAQSEADQLDGLLRFVKGKGLTNALRSCTTSPDACVPFVRGYNGESYAENQYHIKLARAIGAG